MGSYFCGGYRNGCLSWVFIAAAAGPGGTLWLNQCPGAVYLPWEGYILRGTFQAGSVPKIRAAINCSWRKVLLNFQALF